MKFGNLLNHSFYAINKSVIASDGRERGDPDLDCFTRQRRVRNDMISFLFLFLFLLFPALTFATPQVPKTIVFQGILVDAGGNALTDVPSANANISIVDGAGNVRYEEQQNIVIYQGATAFLVGMGTSLDTGEPTGGIPLDVMEPGEGDLILKIKIEGQTISQEDIIFASVPFSFYSQYATELTQPIESKQIKDGAITVSHLSEEVTTYVKSLGVSKEELEEHKTEEAAHTAKNISATNTFKNLMGTDLQMLLESVDYNITLTNKASSQVADGAITSSKIADGTITQADLDMSSFGAWDQNSSDDLTTSTVFTGALSGVYSNLQLSDNSVNTNNIVDGAITASKLAESYLKTTGGTLTGNLNMQNADIIMSDLRTVDGVDVSALEKRVADLENGETPIPNDSISQTIKPYAYGNVDKEGELTSGYGILSVSRSPYSTYEYSVYFSTSRPDTNYSISVTPISTKPYIFRILEKNADGFVVSFSASGYTTDVSGEDIYNFYQDTDDVDFDFIIFANDE